MRPTRRPHYNPGMRLSSVACGIAGVCLAVLASAGPAYRLGLPLPAAFALLRWAAYGGVAGTVVALVATGWAYRQRQRSALALSVLALIAAGSTFGVPYLWMRAAMQRPPIHDISTDLLNPPTFAALVPLREGAPNGVTRTQDVTDLQQRHYPGIQPVTLPVPPGAVFDRALQVAQELDWRIVSADRAAGRLEATDTTRWFGFTDDVVVRLTPWGSGTRVDLRSVSRVGRGDAGTNARRIQAFLERLHAP